MIKRPDQRRLPSVDRIVRDAAAHDLPRPLVVDAARRVLGEMRAGAADNADALERVNAALAELRRSRIHSAINATGVLIHTNLGRSPLGEAVAARLSEVAASYCTLEYDLDSGRRGRRGDYLERCLALLCGAESATIVNNCAAALVLVLRQFALRRPRRYVVISRGELVQIGGGFRIPDILAASGARLREIGTTNQTTVDDYRQAIDDTAAMVLRVHRSNFYMEGFVRSPPGDEIAALTRAAGVPFVDDLGSGATFDTAGLCGGEREPTPQRSLADGAGLVCFSGDKLLGGPQAGIIAGDAGHIAGLKKAAFYRALRCDKLVMAAMESTVELLLAGEAGELPVRAMMQTPADELRRRAERIVAAVAPLRAEVGAGEARIGGGSLPRARLASVTVDLLPLTPADGRRWFEQLRRSPTPVIGYLEAGRVKLDLRTVFPRQDDALIRALRGLVNE
jgi:L-seryl-tRNA(Ser) seleniumtransferase